MANPHAPRTRLIPILVTVLLVSCTTAPPKPAEPSTVSTTINRYLDGYFDMFPSRATAAGRHDRDTRLENFSPTRLDAWIALNRETRRALTRAMRRDISPDDALDSELVLRQTEEEINRFAALRAPERNPLWWTDFIANANVFLLVRDELPLNERLNRAIARAKRIPRLARQAQEALGRTDPSLIAPELARMAAGQARSTATFYRRGFPAIDPARHDLRSVGAQTAKAIDDLASFLDALAGRATGSPILGSDYAENFRAGTGVSTPVDEVLAHAESDLVAKREETARFGRSVWSRFFPDEAPPTNDRALIRKLFDRVSQDHAKTTKQFLAETLPLVAEVKQFVRDHDVVTLPDRGRLVVTDSPSYFIGQSVGGLYSVGPWDPDGETFLFLPTPPSSATPEQQAAFFRDFNDHFMKMIIPHETIPGHALQFRYAAIGPDPVRALFPDPVYVEGWGTFSERLMLDQGWGGPLERLAHLKKQLENIARTIVDIRVHTKGMTRDEMMRFLRDDALQDEQFASNMWMRTITSSPQITTYYLGYSEVSSLYHDVRQARGDRFVLRDFMDGMMKLGPVAVRHYRTMMLGSASTTGMR